MDAMILKAFLTLKMAVLKLIECVIKINFVAFKWTAKVLVIIIVAVYRSEKKAMARFFSETFNGKTIPFWVNTMASLYVFIVSILALFMGEYVYYNFVDIVVKLMG